MAGGEGPTGRGGGDEGGIAIPRIPPGRRDEALVIAQQVALRTKQLVDLLHRARELGLPDPDGLGFTGLDYDTIDAVAFGTLTWSGALLRSLGQGHGQGGGGLILPSDPSGR